MLIVGGNIDGFTRTMTTAIPLETSKGDTVLIGPNGAGKTTLQHLFVLAVALFCFREKGCARTRCEPR